MVNRLLLSSPSKEKAAVELGLPAHLLWLSADRSRREGWELRRDVFIKLSQAAGAAMEGLPETSLKPVAVKIDELAVEVLRGLSFDDPRDGLLSCAFLILKLVDEGLFVDATNQAVLVSMLLTDDAKDEGSEFRFNEALSKKHAGRMLSRLRLLGYYHRFVLSTPTG